MSYAKKSKGTSVKDRNQLACFMHNVFGKICNLPIVEKRKADEMNKNDDDGDENEQSDFGNDQCENDCTVFWGGETVGYFVVQLVRSHGFVSAQKLDVKL